MLNSILLLGKEEHKDVPIAVCTPMVISAFGQVAKMLLIRGLATAAKHRSDDERSAHYEELLEAEQVPYPAAVVSSHLHRSAGRHDM